LKVAPQDFHTINELVQGGFGTIYKVYFLQARFDIEFKKTLLTFAIFAGMT